MDVAISVPYTGCSLYRGIYDNQVIFDFSFKQEQRMEELYSEYCRNKLRSDSLVQKYTDFFFQVCVIFINIEFNNNLIIL